MDEISNENLNTIHTYLDIYLHIYKQMHTYFCNVQHRQAFSLNQKHGLSPESSVFIIIIDNRGLNARWCLTPSLLSLPTAAYLGQRGLTPAGLPHTTAQCHLTILGVAVLFCLNHPSFRTPGSLSFCCRSFCRYGRRGATFSNVLSSSSIMSMSSSNRRLFILIQRIPRVV